MSESSQQPLDVRLTLARPFYRAGGTLVGTIVVRRQLDKTVAAAASSKRPLREALDSLQWRLVGYCRLDPRWHKVKDISSYSQQSQHPDFQAPYKNTLEVWSTQPTELLDLYERTDGRWQDVRPQPIRLPGINVRSPRKKKPAANDRRQLVASASSLSTDTDVPVLEEDQMAFTIRCQLPEHAPPSFSATSCRYFSSLEVRIQPSGGDAVQWLRAPVTVFTSKGTTATTVNDDSLPPLPQSMAHSSGLPCHLIATELQSLEDGQITVHRQGVALYRHMDRHDAGHLQSLRVADEAGKPVCVLTVLGAANLSAGSRFLLKFDFPSPSNDTTESDDKWTPCFQASACVQSQEVVLRPDGSQTRAEYRVLSVANERLDPLTTESTQLSLTLPLNTPCSVQTPVVDISTSCLVDLTVGTLDADGIVTGYRNLRLELPCPIGHGTAAFEVPEPDEEPSTFLSSQNSIVDERRLDPLDPHSFVVHDISDQLKILSLRMAEECGLRPPKPSADLKKDEDTISIHNKVH